LLAFIFRFYENIFTINYYAINDKRNNKFDEIWIEMIEQIEDENRASHKI
jgi:hypothetical protein